jgi:hypothetical protein
VNLKLHLLINEVYFLCVYLFLKRKRKGEEKILEKECKVKPIGIKFVCDSCSNGEMKHTGKMKMFETYVMYQHICEKCGVENNFTEKYPLIRYKFME